MAQIIVSSGFLYSTKDRKLQTPVAYVRWARCLNNPEHVQNQRHLKSGAHLGSIYRRKHVYVVEPEAIRDQSRLDQFRRVHLRQVVLPSSQFPKPDCGKRWEIQLRLKHVSQRDTFSVESFRTIQTWKRIWSILQSWEELRPLIGSVSVLPLSSVSELLPAWDQHALPASSEWVVLFSAGSQTILHNRSRRNSQRFWPQNHRNDQKHSQQIHSIDASRKLR